MENFIYKIKKRLSKDVLKIICSYLSWLDWKIISCAKLSDEFIREFADNLDWYHVNRISATPNIKQQFKKQIDNAVIFRHNDVMKLHSVEITCKSCQESKDETYYYLSQICSVLCKPCFKKPFDKHNIFTQSNFYLPMLDEKCQLCNELLNNTHPPYISDLPNLFVICLSCYTNIHDYYKLINKNYYIQMKNKYIINSTSYACKKIPNNLYFKPVIISAAHWEEQLGIIINHKTIPFKLNILPNNFGSVRQWIMFTHDDKLLHNYNYITFFLVDCNIDTNGRIAIGFISDDFVPHIFIIHDINIYIKYYKEWEHFIAIGSKYVLDYKEFIEYFNNKWLSNGYTID